MQSHSPAKRMGIKILRECDRDYFVLPSFVLFPRPGYPPPHQRAEGVRAVHAGLAQGPQAQVQGKLEKKSKKSVLGNAKGGLKKGYGRIYSAHWACIEYSVSDILFGVFLHIYARSQTTICPSICSISHDTIVFRLNSVPPPSALTSCVIGASLSCALGCVPGRRRLTSAPASTRARTTPRWRGAETPAY